MSIAGITVYAATTGSVSGIVKDAANTPISGANVVIEGTTLTTVTDDQGRFVITNVPPGDYQVTVQMVGYRTETLANVQVIMDSVASADFSLTEQAIAEEAVVVNRPRPMINPEMVNTFNLVNVQQETQTRTDALSVRTAPGVLSTLPGVIVESDGTGQMHLRGGKPDQVGWYFEGIPITDPNTGTFGTNLMTTGMSQFQMYTGAFSAEYGNAISGALNEVIKTGVNTPGLNTATEGGGNKFGSMVGEFGGGESNSFNYYVSANVMQGDVDSTFIKRLEYSDNVVKMVWPSAKDKITLVATEGSQVGLLENYHTIDAYNNPVSAEKDSIQQRFALGGVEWSHNINSGSYVSVQPYYHFFTGVTSAMGGSFGSGQGTDIWSNRMGIQAKYVNQLNPIHSIKLGGSFVKSNNNYFLALYYPEWDYYYPYFNADVDTTDNSLYAEDQMTLSEKLIFTAGIRRDSITYDRTGLAYVEGSGYTGDPVGDVTESKVTPRFGVSYAGDSTSAWKASWGKYSKFVPSNAAQTIYCNPADEAWGPGLGSTDPQMSTNYELTYEKQATDTLAWRATYFHNHFDNLGIYELLNSGAYLYTNVGEGKSEGVELYVRKKMSDNWQGWLSYTNAKARSNRADFGLNDQMYYTTWDQRDTLSMVTEYKNKNLVHSLRADYGSGRPDRISDATEIAIQSRANPYIIFSYNMKMSLPQGSSLGDSLYLDIYNIFNNHQTLQWNANATGKTRDSWIPSRSFSLGLTKAY